MSSFSSTTLLDQVHFQSIVVAMKTDLQISQVSNAHIAVFIEIINTNTWLKFWLFWN